MIHFPSDGMKKTSLQPQRANAPSNPNPINPALQTTQPAGNSSQNMVHPKIPSQATPPMIVNTSNTERLKNALRHHPQ